MLSRTFTPLDCTRHGFRAKRNDASFVPALEAKPQILPNISPSNRIPFAVPFVLLSTNIYLPLQTSPYPKCLCFLTFFFTYNRRDKILFFLTSLIIIKNILMKFIYPEWNVEFCIRHTLCVTSVMSAVSSTTTLLSV